MTTNTWQLYPADYQPVRVEDEGRMTGLNALVRFIRDWRGDKAAYLARHHSSTGE